MGKIDDIWDKLFRAIIIVNVIMFILWFLQKVRIIPKDFFIPFVYLFFLFTIIVLAFGLFYVMYKIFQFLFKRVKKDN